MDLNLSGKTALVSGSTAGIGLAIARMLAKMGATVVVNGRDKSRVDQAIAKISAEVPEAKLIAAPGDLSTAAGAKEVTDAVPECDVLVLNTGIFEQKDFFEIPDEDWERLFQTNVMSGVRLARAYTKAMVAKKWGRVIFISSESALHCPENMIHYGMSKVAQLSIARGLAQALPRGCGVTVNSVLPGPTRTELLEDLFSRSGAPIEQAAEGFLKAARPSSLNMRLASVDEVANMVCYVASPASSATNGACLRCDGGIVQTVGH